MKTIAALFDCDGTLYSAQFGRGLMACAKSRGRKIATGAYYASVFFPYLLGKFGLIKPEKGHRPLISNMAKLIRGLNKQEADKEFDWIIQNYLLPTQRMDIVTRLHDHQAQGHATVLVSGVLAPALARIAAFFDATGFVGTQVEIHNSQFTGRIIPPVITGEDKERYTCQFFSSRKIDVDWNASYAYADSITDIGLFEMVGNPIAVYPDPNLQIHAQEAGWEIIENGKA